MPTLHTRLAILLVFAAFGASVGAWAGAIPQVTEAAGLGKVGQGLGLAVSSLAGVLAMAAGGPVGRILSNRAALLMLLPLLFASSLALHVSGGPLGFFLAITAFGAAIGMMDVFMNAEASHFEVGLGRPVLTSFHAAVSGFIGIFALLGSLLASRFGAPAASLATLPVLFAAFVMVLRHVAPIRLPGRGRGLPPRSAMPALFLLGAAAGLIIIAETSALFWSARLLREQAPQLASIAGLGVAFFSLCTALVRSFGDRLRQRFSDRRLMMASLGLGTVSFAALGFSTQLSTSVVAFAFCGFSLAILIPVMLVMASELTWENRAAGIGFMFAIAGAPRIAAPWVFGVIAERASTGTAFGLLAILILVALVLVLSLPRFLPRPLPLAANS